LQGSQTVTEVYSDKSTYISDLSLRKGQLIDFDYLDEYYPTWIGDTGRENSMNESGMLIDFIGYARKGLHKTNLLMIV
jgi:hypothetical protein